MKLQYISFLGIILLGLIQQSVLAKRRGGGGGSSGNSNSGSGGGGGGGSSEPYCYVVPTITGGTSSTSPKSWLYRWVGTYYNGSIETKIKITNTSQTCGDQDGVFTAKYDGVLTLAEMPAGIERGELSPFIFLLSGWKPGTEPTGEVDVLNSLLPDDVMLYMNSITSPRSTYFDGSVSWLLKVNKQGSGYAFTGKMDDSTVAAYDDSNWAFDVSPCNGSNPSHFDMHPFDSYKSSYDSQADYDQQRNQLNGTFDSSEASVDFIGEFSGSFPDGSSTGGAKFGRYLMRFSGTVDKEHSHTLVTAGNNPSWQANPDLLPSATATGSAASATTCVSYMSSAISFKSGVGKTLYGVAAIIVVMIVLL